ncbi:MAG: hypothetical protein V2A73_01065 [Pseudomonadota bacterium]
MIIRLVSGTVLVALALCGCGEAKSSGEQAVLNKLMACQQERDLAKQERERAKTATDMCTKQLDEQRNQRPANEILVRLEGDILRVFAGGAPQDVKIGAEDATRLSNAIIAEVKGSRTAIQQCYVAALKKNEAIQARKIDGKVLVSFDQQGSAKSASFTPRISDDFTACIRGVSSRWKVPPFQQESTTFEVPIILQPAE